MNSRASSAGDQVGVHRPLDVVEIAGRPEPALGFGLAAGIGGIVDQPGDVLALGGNGAALGIIGDIEFERHDALWIQCAQLVEIFRVSRRGVNPPGAPRQQRLDKTAADAAVRAGDQGDRVLCAGLLIGRRHRTDG